MRLNDSRLVTTFFTFLKAGPAGGHPRPDAHRNHLGLERGERHRQDDAPPSLAGCRIPSLIQPSVFQLLGSAHPSGCVAPPDQAFTQNVVGRFGVGEAAGDHLGGEAAGEALGELETVDRFGGDP
jgi:hypothetical protein